CSGKDWYKKISDYNTASPTQRIEIVQTDEYGYGLKVYIDGHYSKQASDNLMYAQSQDYLKEMGMTAVTMTGELTGAYDVYRLFTGKDPLTGDKTGRLEAGLWTAILLLPQAKMVMAAKELKAGNKALKGLNLTEKELKLLNKAEYFEDVGKLEKVSGTGTQIGKHSVETLNRDQTRTIVENLLDNGEISLKDLQNMIPEGTPNTFKPTDTMKNGAKYEFQLSDGQKAIVRWHEPDPVAAAKFPDSASGSRWTAQIKIGNKQVTIDGLWTKKQNLNEVHVPIQGR
ncbi:pre-toxin TG domain-containing protein, partial [Carnobacterium gallinarum]